MYIEAISGVQSLCQGSQRHKMDTLNTKAPQNSVKKKYSLHEFNFFN